MFDNWSTLKKLIWLRGSPAGGVTPVEKTKKAAIVHITDALAKPVVDLVCYINPLQSGTGDPSPTNVRPISGWTGCNVYREATYDPTANPTVQVSWQSSAGTVYGGTVDPVTGKLRVTMAQVDLGTLTWVYNSTYSLFIGFFSGGPAITPTGSNNILCSEYKKYYTGSAINLENISDKSVVLNTSSMSQNNERIIVKDTNYSDAATFTTAMSGIQFIYELGNPIEYTLTEQELTLLLGENNIWHDANGDTEVTYLADGRASDEEAANILLGGSYRRSPDDPDEATDEEAVNILLGGA